MDKVALIELINSLDESTDKFDTDVAGIKRAMPDVFTHDQIEVIRALLSQGPELLEYLELI